MVVTITRNPASALVQKPTLCFRPSNSRQTRKRGWNRCDWTLGAPKWQCNHALAPGSGTLAGIAVSGRTPPGNNPRLSIGADISSFGALDAATATPPVVRILRLSTAHPPESSSRPRPTTPWFSTTRPKCRTRPLSVPHDDRCGGRGCPPWWPRPPSSTSRISSTTTRFPSATSAPGSSLPDQTWPEARF